MYTVEHEAKSGEACRIAREDDGDDFGELKIQLVRLLKFGNFCHSGGENPIFALVLVSFCSDNLLYSIRCEHLQPATTYRPSSLNPSQSEGTRSRSKDNTTA
jgi:hypothetical protein